MFRESGPPGTEAESGGGDSQWLSERSGTVTGSGADCGEVESSKPLRWLK